MKLHPTPMPQRGYLGNREMMYLTKDELAAEIYAVLRKSPNGKDDEVSQKCAREVMRAEAAKSSELNPLRQ